jgi:hypothetical protein
LVRSHGLAVKEEDSRQFKVLFHPHLILILVSKKKKKLKWKKRKLKEYQLESGLGKVRYIN